MKEKNESRNEKLFRLSFPYICAPPFLPNSEKTSSAERWGNI